MVTQKYHSATNVFIFHYFDVNDILKYWVSVLAPYGLQQHTGSPRIPAVYTVPFGITNVGV